MAHSIPELIVLEGKFNKLIRKGMSNKEPSPKPSQQRRGKGRDAKRLYGGMADRSKSTMTTIDGKRLDKPIQVYRMWYRFLQLALELEQQKVVLVTKMQKQPLKKPRKDKWGKLQKFEMVPLKARVKVNRKKYEGWDLDSIPTTSFDDWWFGSLFPNRQMFP